MHEPTQCLLLVLTNTVGVEVDYIIANFPNSVEFFGEDYSIHVKADFFPSLLGFSRSRIYSPKVRSATESMLRVVSDSSLTVDNSAASKMTIDHVANMIFNLFKQEEGLR